MKTRAMGAFLAVVVALPGCAAFFGGKDAWKTPELVECNTVTRYVPGDKVILVPWAFGQGTIATTAITLDILFDFDPWWAVPLNVLNVPWSMSYGMAHTAFDTLLNAGAWIPLEVYEASTGETWAGPYTPQISAIVTGHELAKRIERSR